MNHQEKQRIFDELSTKQWGSNFKEFLSVTLDEVRHYERSKEEGVKQIIDLILEACDLVQEEQQKRIADNATTKTVFTAYGPQQAVEKASIINPENKIQ